MFTHWIKDRVEKLGFIEGEDFVCFPFLGSKEGRGGHNTKDYFLSIDMAKHLAMLERNDKGHLKFELADLPKVGGVYLEQAEISVLRFERCYRWPEISGHLPEAGIGAPKFGGTYNWTKQNCGVR